MRATDWPLPKRVVSKEGVAGVVMSGSKVWLICGQEVLACEAAPAQVS
jgi:hypothetical protein